MEQFVLPVPRGETSLNTVTDLLTSIRSLRLLEPAQLDKVAAVQAKIPEPQALLKKLVSQGWLTAFQAKMLYAGRGNELLLGSYVMIDKLGEGGMGEVYKAKNWKIGKTVALKIIRKEKLKNATSVKRFHREIEMAARLGHPNIVQAFDAGQVGTTHFFAMEFIEGQDLTQMVKQSGPLPVEKATEYMRQAALGLQHASEKGLIHRDIKPSNIFVSKAQGAQALGVVKLLDMGLARMDDSEDMSTLTQEGSVLGTIDYLAPEQALNAHKADIRSDLYSLGCTFYYILAGKVPFDGGSATEKLLKHRLEEPKPLGEIRKDVPASVVGIVRKLMAKRPEDRYQTPADLVADLSGKVGRLARAAPPSKGPLDSGAANPQGSKPLWKKPLVIGGAAAAFLLLFVVTLLALSGKDEPKSSNSAPSGGTATGTKPNKPTQPEPHYAKMATREESILATLKSAGLPTLEGNWHMIGYFDMGFNVPFETAYPPENRIDLKGSYPGKNKQTITWKRNSDFHPGEYVQFTGLMGPVPHHLGSITYFYREINVPEAIDLPIRLGGEDFLTVFLNGESVFSRKGLEGLGPYKPENNSATLRLKPGTNHLLLKVGNGLSKAVIYLCPQWPAKLNAMFGESLNRDFPVR
jgi:serine/threonine protein kinase